LLAYAERCRINLDCLRRVVSYLQTTEARDRLGQLEKRLDELHDQRIRIEATIANVVAAIEAARIEKRREGHAAPKT